MAKLLGGTRIYGTATVDSTLTISGQVVSTVTTGTAPFSVASTTPVANLAATTATNIGTGTVNQIPYQTATGITGFSANLTYTVGTSTFSVGNIIGSSSAAGSAAPSFFLTGGSATATQTGSAARLAGGAATGTSKAGGGVSLFGGASTSGIGGSATITSGGGTTGGAVSVTTGGGTTGPSGDLTIATGGGPTVGALSITGGQNSGTGAGGSVSFKGGNASASGTGGALTFTGGDSFSGNGGALTFTGGNATSYGAVPASLTLAGGLTTGAGSNVNIQAGDAGFGSGANPGNITITTGLIDGGTGGTGGGYFAVVNQNNPSYPLKIAVDAAGTTDQIGFFNVTPVVKPAPTASGTQAVLSSVVTALNSLGLVDSAALTNASTLTAAGANTQIQYNNAGAFGGSSTFTFTSATSLLTLGNLQLTGSTGIITAPNAVAGAAGQNITVRAANTNTGASGGVYATGGSLTLSGGGGTGTIRGAGGSVVIQAGNSGTAGGTWFNNASTSIFSGVYNSIGTLTRSSIVLDSGANNATEFDPPTDYTGASSISLTAGSGTGATFGGNIDLFPGSAGAGTDCGALRLYPFRTALDPVIEINTGGSFTPLLGFFSATPVAKPAPIASGPFAVLNQVVSALNNLGLISATNLTYSAATPVTLTYAATITPASSSKITYRMTMTGNLVINAPSGAADGDQVEFWLTASGGARTVTFTFAHIPSSSTLTSPVTIASGTQGELMFSYDATLGGWKAARFVNGYT